MEKKKLTKKNVFFQSIIRKVKSRVSSIFPDFISKRFLPSDKNDSKNGSIRRRREESSDDEDGSFIGRRDPRLHRESEIVVEGPPPSKRTKSILNEVSILKENWRQNSKKY